MKQEPLYAPSPVTDPLTDSAHAPKRRHPARAVVYPAAAPQRHMAPDGGDQNGSRQVRACRLINVAVALGAIILAAPIMLLLAVLIRATSPGPAVFRQDRVGIDRRDLTRRRPGPPGKQRDRGGRIFTMYKFRTMRTGADAAGEVWASQGDPRVTPIGAFLRATRLDELPQFFNVLKGDMNVVGPRPEQPSIFEALSEDLQGYRGRQRVLPGITGLAQIKLGYDTDLASATRKNELDLEYIKSRSVPQDLRIMALTLPVMLGRKVWSSEPDNGPHPDLMDEFSAQA